MKQASKPIKAWAGLTGGKIDKDWIGFFVGGSAWEAPIVFLSRREALKRYGDVRRVEIREVPRKKKGRKK